MPANRILLGVITGAHGIRGDVVVHTFAAEPEDVAAYGPLADTAGTRTFTLHVVRVTPKGGVIARVTGVADRNAAEALKGTELYVDRGKLPAAGDGEYYHSDLIGLAAVTPEGLPIGEIVTVQNYGAGDLLEIRLAGKTSTELIPFTDSFVPDVDLAARRVTIVLPEAAPQDEDEDEA